MIVWFHLVRVAQPYTEATEHACLHEYSEILSQAFRKLLVDRQVIHKHAVYRLAYSARGSVVAANVVGLQVLAVTRRARDCRWCVMPFVFHNMLC